MDNTLFWGRIDGAGKSPPLTDLLAQTGHPHGFTFIVEDNPPVAPEPARPACKRLERHG